MDIIKQKYCFHDILVIMNLTATYLKTVKYEILGNSNRNAFYNFTTLGEVLKKEIPPKIPENLN